MNRHVMNLRFLMIICKFIRTIQKGPDLTFTMRSGCKLAEGALLLAWQCNASRATLRHASSCNFLMERPRL